MATPAVTIKDRRIGIGEPCYLIAEVGTTCLGDIEMARKLIEAGAAAGVDAVKFQVIDPEQMSDTSVTYTYRSGGQTYTANMHDMFRRLTFSEADWRDLAEYCEAQGVHFFATVDFLAGVDMLERLDVPAHKIGAWDGTFRPLIERIGATGKPTFVDLGPTSEAEIEDLAAWYRVAGGGPLVLLHDFHTDIDAQMNLRTIPWLRERFPALLAGFSSPGRDDDLDMAALGLGAVAIEKRLILDRGIRAFHADESMEPAELKSWVERMRHVERALGPGGLRPSDKDRADAEKYYRSICTLADIRAGDVLTPETLGGKRPGTGLPTARLPEFWDRRAARDLPANTLLTEGDIE